MRSYLAEKFKITRVLCGVYWLLIGICFVNLGANDPVVVALAMISASGLLIVVICLTGMPENTRAAVIVSVGVAVFLFFWIILQTTHLPGEIFANPAWTATEGVSPLRHPPVISVTPGDDYIAYLKFALPIALLITGLFLFRTDHDAEKILGYYSWAIVVIAMLSLAQFFLFPNTLVLSEKRFYADSLTGFFVNRNTAATFFGLGTLLLFAQAWKQFDRAWWRYVLFANPPQTWSDLRVSFRQSRFVVSALAVLAPLLALVATKSRAGVSFSFLAILVFVLIMVLTARAPSGASGTRWRLTFRIFAGIAVIAVAFSVLGARVITKLEVRGLDDPRFCVLPGMIRAVRDQFPLGGGFASFQEIFSAYRDPSCGLSGVWDKAHNLYVEGMLAIGIAFPIILLICVGYLSWAFTLGVRNRKRYRFAGALGYASLVLVTLHSGFDFSLQIPGFAIAYAAFLAPLVTLCLRPSQSAVVK